MSGDLRDRAKALENEFFHRVDQQLMDQIRQQELAKTRREELCGATGICDAQLLDELVALGVSAETMLVLGLIPLVHVAACDGHVTDAECAAIMQAARDTGCAAGSSAHQLLESWLNSPLSAEAFAAWQSYVRAVRPRLTPEARQALRKDLLDRATAVAKAAGGILGLAAISSQERRALDEIAHTLES